MTLKTISPLAAMLALSVLLGCQPASQPSTGTPAATQEHDDHDHDHDHPEHGPHDGELIELGHEEYHAELLLAEDSDLLTIYILDSSATKAVDLEATEITINVKGKEKAQQFKLKAVEEQPGNSQFALTDAALHALLDEPESKLTLVVTIAGKQYRGEFQHNHEHDHDHAH